MTYLNNTYSDFENEFSVEEHLKSVVDNIKDSSFNVEKAYIQAISKVPVLTKDEEAHWGFEMDDSRKKMMACVFSTRLGIEMILNQISSFCRGELKLKDLLGHRQMDDDEREELSEKLIAANGKLSALKASDRGKNHTKIVELIKSLNLGMDYMLSIVHYLQTMSTKLMNARSEWLSLCKLLGVDSAVLCENMCKYIAHEPCRFLKNDDQYRRYSVLYNNYQAERKNLMDKVGSIDDFEASMISINNENVRYEKARSIMIESNLRLVVNQCRRFIKDFKNRKLDFLDLVQEGNIGLMRAVEKFDYTMDNKFSTYATWWIKQSITRANADLSRTIRIPVHLVEVITRIQKAQRELRDRLNRFPSKAEVAAFLNMSEKTVESMLAVNVPTCSLDQSCDDDEENPLYNHIDSQCKSPMADLEEEAMCSELSRVLHTLTPREERILRMRFGIGETQTFTLEDVGREFSLTRERIRQIEARAIEKLFVPAQNCDLALCV